MKDATVGNLALVQTMTSREIAELTGKVHSNVMRDCRIMVEQFEADSKNGSTNSELNWYCVDSSFLDKKGEERRQYVLDKNTCLALISGYSAVLRMRIIHRWQELEEAVAKKADIVPMTNGELLVFQAQIILKLEQEQARQAAKLDTIETRQFQMQETMKADKEENYKRQTKLLNNQKKLSNNQHEQDIRLRKVEEHIPPEGYHTVMGFLNKEKSRLTTNEASLFGRRVSSYCRKHGFEVVKVYDKRYGEVNSYPLEALEECWQDF